MTTAKKCEAIVRWIVDEANREDDFSSDPVFRLAIGPDNGESSLTLYLRKGHSHVGSWWDARTPESFAATVDQLYSLVIEGKGLSFE